MKVLIATPMYGGMCTAGYTSSMIELFKRASFLEDIQLEFMYGVNEALVTRARNMCVSIFLKSDATHLLFIDSDIQFNAEQIIAMLRTKKDFVCGIYPKKKIDWDAVKHHAVMGIRPDQLQARSSEYLFIPSGDMVQDADGLIEIERAGTGMMMISRTVFETLSNQVQSFKLEAPVMSNVRFEDTEEYKEFFYTCVDPTTKIFLHEDFNFCRLWKETGGKIYGASWVALKHIGTHTFG